MNKRLGCGVAGLLFVALVVWLAMASDTAGVLVANEIPTELFTQFQSDGIGADEPVVAFVEVSLGSVSEYAVLTDSRLVYVKDGRLTAMDYSDVASFEAEKGMLETSLIVKGKTGDMMRILFVPGDEDLFMNLLEEQVALASNKAAPAPVNAPATDDPE